MASAAGHDTRWVLGAISATQSRHDRFGAEYSLSFPTHLFLLLFVCFLFLPGATRRGGGGGHVAEGPGGRLGRGGGRGLGPGRAPGQSPPTTSVGAGWPRGPLPISRRCPRRDGGTLCPMAPALAAFRPLPSAGAGSASFTPTRPPSHGFCSGCMLRRGCPCETRCPPDAAAAIKPPRGGSALFFIVSGAFVAMLARKAAELGGGDGCPRLRAPTWCERLRSR